MKYKEEDFNEFLLTLKNSGVNVKGIREKLKGLHEIYMRTSDDEKNAILGVISGQLILMQEGFTKEENDKIIKELMYNREIDYTNEDNIKKLKQSVRLGLF